MTDARRFLALIHSHPDLEHIGRMTGAQCRAEINRICRTAMSNMPLEDAYGFMIEALEAQGYEINERGLAWIRRVTPK